MILSFLLQKEFTRIRRNRFVPRLIVMFPIMVMCVVPWVTTMEVNHVGVRVVDNDHSTLSERITHEIEASRYFSFCGVSGTYKEALDEMERGHIDLIAVIPSHFERRLVRGEGAQVLIAANAVNGSKGGLGSARLSGVISGALQQAAMAQPLAQGQTAAATRSVVVKRLYNQHEDYKQYMIPALMTVIMVMLCGFLPALDIVGEKEAGTIEQMNVTPVKKWQFILSKLIPYWIIGMVDLTLCFILAWAVFGIVPEGSTAVLYLFSALLAVVFSSFGLVISNYSDTMQQAMFVMWFFMVCMMLLSGLFTPVASMPGWAQGIAHANPLYYYIGAMRSVFLRGTSLPGVLSSLTALAAFALGMGGWAVASYRKNG
jgi:ABC-2 type transport system permease protein